MRVHYLQHVPFEGLGVIEQWLASKGAKVSVSQLFRGDVLPAASDFDWLICIGKNQNESFFVAMILAWPKRFKRRP